MSDALVITVIIVSAASIATNAMVLWFLSDAVDITRREDEDED